MIDRSKSSIRAAGAVPETTDEHRSDPPWPSATTRVAVAGFLTTAVTFGPARSAFGLFVPVFRSEFGLRTAEVGLIAAVGYLGFLAGLVVALRAGRRRATVVCGAVAATAGMATIASAPHATILAVGVFTASSSAGVTWTPFNAITERAVPSDRSDSTLAIVSTGTALGLAGTGSVAAMVVGDGLAWRQAWAAFALAGVVVAIAAAVLLPRPPSPPPRPKRWLRELRLAASCPGTPRLLITGSITGVGSSVWVAFAVDAVVAEDGGGRLGSSLVGPAMFVVLGACGLVAVGTGRLISRSSLAVTTRAALAAIAVSLILVGAVPSELPAALCSAGLQGVGIMVASACLASASLRLHHARPVEGFTAVLLAVGGGNIVGAASAGALADRFGLGATLVAIGSALAAASYVVTQPRRPRNSSADEDGPA
ncbi:MAG: MFS transporter [Acidimicrobiales bacterium]